MTGISNMELNEIAQRYGAEHGFDKVTAKFGEIPEFKIRWLRMGTQIDFEVSDYLEDAPEEVVEDIMSVIYRRMSGDEADYSYATIEHLTSEKFRKVHAGTYFERRGMIPDDDGHIEELYHQLVDEGLLKEADIRFGWGRQLNMSNSGSVLFRTVAIDDHFRWVPDASLKMIVYAAARYVTEMTFSSHPENPRHLMAGYYQDYLRLKKDEVPQEFADMLLKEVA